MRAVTIDPAGAAQYVTQQRQRPQPAAGEVLLQMRAASVNFRDALLRAHPVSAYAGDLRGRVPLSDGVGIVAAVGDGVSDIKPGDRMMPSFFPDWLGQPLKASLVQRSLGGSVDGVLADYAVFDARAVVPAPAHLSDVEAATLPCAALTAWSALVDCGAAQAGQTILIQGTGGVSLFALQLAKQLGLRTIVSSSSDAKLARARALGADETLNYRTSPDWAASVRALTNNEGVDHLLDVGGEATLQSSLRALALGGHLSLIGLLTGTGASIAQQDLLGRNLHLHAISVGSARGLADLSRFVTARKIRPVIDRIFSFDDANAAVDELTRGTHFGKLAIQIAQD